MSWEKSTQIWIFLALGSSDDVDEIIRVAQIFRQID